MFSPRRTGARKRSHGRLKASPPMRTQIDKVYEPQRFEPHGPSGGSTTESSAPARKTPAVPSRSSSRRRTSPARSTWATCSNHTEIDVVVRWQRMLGDNTLWLPGTDHAGIATQMVVERQLAEEGINAPRPRPRGVRGARLGVEGAIRRHHQEADDPPRRQLRLDARALHPGRRPLARRPRSLRAPLRRGLIYRGEYMVNWCPRCQTALSDLEVDARGNAGQPLAHRLSGERHATASWSSPPRGPRRCSATPRSPSIPRTSATSTCTARPCMLPLMDREIPIILDDLADPEVRHRRGEGHARARSERLRSRQAPQPAADQGHRRDGKMTAAAGPYAGLDRFEARKRVVADLEAHGLLVKIEDYTLSARHAASAARPSVEPLVSTQWFVKTKPLAEPAIARRGRRPHPASFPSNWSKTYFDWMYNIRDWCISRQLWWGHRIPAWHCERMRRDHRGARRRRRRARTAARTTSSRTPMCSTPGSAPGSGRSRRSAGPTRPRTWRRSTRRRC